MTDIICNYQSFSQQIRFPRNFSWHFTEWASDPSFRKLWHKGKKSRIMKRFMRCSRIIPAMLQGSCIQLVGLFPSFQHSCWLKQESWISQTQSEEVVKRRGREKKRRVSEWQQRRRVYMSSLKVWNINSAVYCKREGRGHTGTERGGEVWNTLWLVHACLEKRRREGVLAQEWKKRERERVWCVCLLGKTHTANI